MTHSISGLALREIITRNHGVSSSIGATASAMTCRLAVIGAVLLAAGCAQAERPQAAPAQPATQAPVAAPAPAPETPAAAPTVVAPATQDPFDYGTLKPVPADANAQVASVAEALKNKTHPERLSPLVPPKPFDLAAYRRDPKAYLNVIEPGRVFQVAQPGPEVRRLEALGETQPTITQAGTATLRVKAAPGMPVTWTSFDAGRFSNSLTSITVAADDRGVAETTFTGGSGTIDQVNILASCPVTSGQVTYHVTVTR